MSEKGFRLVAFRLVADGRDLGCYPIDLRWRLAYLEHLRGIELREIWVPEGGEAVN